MADNRNSTLYKLLLVILCPAQHKIVYARCRCRCHCFASLCSASATDKALLHTHTQIHTLLHTQNVDKLFQAYLPFFLFLSSAMVSHIKLCIGPRFASFLVSISPHFASPRLAFLALPLRLPCALIKLSAEINSYVSLANSSDGEYMRFGFRFLFFGIF